METLGLRQQSHSRARAKIDRGYEELGECRERVFPVAAARRVRLLIMMPFAGGLLSKSEAMPPHDWYEDDSESVAAGDVLRLILEEAGVSVVISGSCSAEEAEENAHAATGRFFCVDGSERGPRVRPGELSRTTNEEEETNAADACRSY